MNFEPMHRLEVVDTVELKICTHCGSYFLRGKADEVFCRKCVSKPYVRQAIKQPSGNSYWISGLRKWRGSA